MKQLIFLGTFLCMCAGFVHAQSQPQKATQPPASSVGKPATGIRQNSGAPGVQKPLENPARSNASRPASSGATGKSTINEKAQPAQSNTPATAPANAPAPGKGARLKKDGTPDKRYKENQRLKKDGTPDMRYKENKQKAK